MRPTTALDDNVFDFDYLLHPGTKFEHPRDVVSHRGSHARRETSHPGLVGLRRLRDRVLPRAAGARRIEGAGDYRRDLRSALHVGWRPLAPTRRQTYAAAVERTPRGGLKRMSCDR